MDYTLETLKDILRKRLQDQEFDGDTLTIFLNQSLNEILGEDKYPFMQRIDEYYVDEVDGEISLPPGYGGTFFLYAKKPKQPREELKFISPDEFFHKNKAEQMVYTSYGGTLYYRLRQGPHGEDCLCDDYKIVHLYLENPLPLKKDSDRTPIPPEYIEALILGALSRAEQLRDNFDYAQIYQNQQDTILTNMKLRYGPGNLTAQNTAKLPYFGGYADDRI